MMICDADFDDLFPPKTRPAPRRAATPSPTAHDRTERAQLQTSGEKTLRTTEQARAAKAHPSPHGPRLPNPAHAGIMAAMMPAMAAYGAIFSTYESASKKAKNG